MKELTLADKLDAAETVGDVYDLYVESMSSDVTDGLDWIAELRKMVRRLDEGGTE